MSEFEKLLDEVVQGRSSLAPVRAWLDERLQQHDCDRMALYGVLERAQHAGLSQPVAMALRKQIDASQTQTHTVTAVTHTATQPGDTSPTQVDTLRSKPTGTDTDRTVTAPATGQTGPDRQEDAAYGSTGIERTVMLNTTDRSKDDATITGTSDRAANPANEFDPFVADATASADASQPTVTSIAQKREKTTADESAKVGPGSVLKDRFELVNVLGEGGMGTVYRARDLLKVEAKDKNPFMAVKTLSGDFRQHPEAFMALQREASKAQRLAHPNIATVFDFDRDRSTIYLTMELMEGEELSSFIKRLPAGGLPVPEAMNLIKQLCDGLAYAHSKGLVHSDFKPGNAFITTEGTVKLLDFGIARASKTRRDASGVTTIFDPSELGALTPAYASLEMFDGDDPDPRDDIYALACVSYELLTGKHPFNKLSAPKVLEKGLRPAPISKLRKRQNRALLAALAIQRQNRTPTVEAFWEGIRPQKSRLWQYSAMMIAGLAMLTLLGYKPVESYLRTRRNNDIVARIQSGHVDIPSILTLIRGYDFESQRYILENSKTRIIKYFEAQAEAFVNQSHDQYNFPAAFDEIATATQYYSDSAELLQEKSSLESRRASLLASLTKQFNGDLATGKIIPGKRNSIIDVIRILRTADPGNPLLHDERLTSEYAQLIQKATQTNHLAVAHHILVAALDYAPTDAELLNLQDHLRYALRQQRDGGRIAALEHALRSASPHLQSLDGFAAVRADMLTLTRLNPGDAILKRLDTILKGAVQAALNSDSAAKNWQGADHVLYAYAPFLDLDYLLAQRVALLQSETINRYVPVDLQSRLQRIKRRQVAIANLLAKPAYDRDWDAKLMELTQQTAAILQLGDLGWFDTMRKRIANTYVNLAQQRTRQNRFDAATALLAVGKQYAPKLPTFAEAARALAMAVQKFNQRQERRLRLAQTAALENQFQTQLNAGQIGDAKKTYSSLQPQLPANDAFFTTDAPRAYANAYLHLAKARAAIGDYHGAVSLVKGGLRYAPLSTLAQALRTYRAQAARSDLLRMVSTLQPDEMNTLKSKLVAVRKLFPAEQTGITQNLFDRLAEHIEALKTTDLGLADALLSTAKSAFPQSRVIGAINLPPAPKRSAFATLGRAAMAQADLSKAQEYLEQGQRSQPGNQDLEQFGTQLRGAQANANRYFIAYQEYLRADEAPQAKAYLAEAISLWADNRQYLTEYQRTFATNQAPVRSPNGGRPCTDELAGYGRQGRAECYDLLGHGLEGPMMVVVPAGDGFRQPFVIGKYEVSVGEVNAYCHASHQCQPLSGDSGLPATNIPFGEVKSYVAWLSARSHEHYFIPSYSQYRYAASVGGTDTNRDFNCRVVLAGKVIKGMTLVSIETGRPNAWGLVNYVGNAQEWVLGTNGLEAVGGSYRDPLAQCGVNLTRPSDGLASPITGFRLGRNLDE